MLQHHGLAGFGRGHQQSALALADRADHVDHAPGDVFLAGNIPLRALGLGREQRGEVSNRILFFEFSGGSRYRIDLTSANKRSPSLECESRPRCPPVCRLKRRICEARHRYRPGRQYEYPGSEEAETILQHLQRAISVNAFALTRLIFQQCKDKVLVFAGAGTSFHE